MTGERDSGVDDLRRALSVYFEERVEGGASCEELLARHPELRDLLEPMLEGEGEEESGVEVAATPERGFADPVADGAAETPVREFGDFRIVRELGRGGMGVVYEARQRSLGRTVALKLLLPDRTLDPSAIVRFRREAAAAAALDHPGIVKVHATGTLGETHWIAMDFIEGAPLDEVVDELRERHAGLRDDGTLFTVVARHTHLVSERRGGTEADELESTGPRVSRRSYVASAVDIVAQVAEALQHAHARGVVHRDVKPANVLVCAVDGRAVLTDFGIARRENLPSVTADGSLTGTPYYIAPEQIEGDPSAVDARADVFSLGVTLFELLTLRRPFDGRTSREVLDRIVCREPPDPQRLNRELPADLAAVVLTALEKKPDRRYQTAAALAADLRAFLDHRPVSARRPGPAQRLLRWARREPAKATLAVVLSVSVPGLTGLTGYLLATRQEVAAGERALREEEFEEALAVGFFEFGEEDLESARRSFEAARSAAPERAEPYVGLTLVATREEGYEAGLRFLRAGVPPSLARTAPLRRLEVWLLRYLGRDEEASGIAPEDGVLDGALDAYVAGLLELQRAIIEESHARIPHALGHLETAVQAAPRARLLFHFEFAHVVGMVRDRTRAARCEVALRRLWPDSWLSWFWIGYAWGEVDPARAARAAERAVELAPGRWRSWSNLGTYRQEIDDLSGSAQAFSRALELHPQSYEIWSDLANVRQRLGDTDGARAAEDRAIELNPEHAQSLRAIGTRALWEGDPQRARALLERSVNAPEIDPGRHLGWFQLGLARSQLGDLEGAREAYERRLAHSRAPGALTNLGNVLLRLGDREGARARYEEAIEVHPTLMQANRCLAKLLQVEDSPEPLGEHARAWIERMPDCAEAYACLALYHRWCAVAGESGAPAEALAAGQRAAELCEYQDATVMHEFGAAQFLCGQVDKAIATLELAEQLAAEEGLPASVQRVIASDLARFRAAARK